VSQGSSSERALGGRLKLTKLRTFPTLEAAGLALQRGEIDAFATNKGILFELARRVPGSRVLDGRWGTEHLAPAIAQGRNPAGLAYVQAFTQDVRRNGELDRATQRAGLRGTVAPAP
jgi:polar amino acid transport system substrate-binding protein